MEKIEKDREDVWLLSFVVQDRISCTDSAVNFRWQITTDIGSWQNKAGNAMSVIQSSDVIGKNEDESDITQDVDVLVWWRDVGRARFPHITVMTRQFLTIPAASTTAERVFSFTGLNVCLILQS